MIISTISFFQILLFLNVSTTKNEAAGEGDKAEKGKGTHQSHWHRKEGIMCGQHRLFVPLRYKSEQNGEMIELIVSEDRIEAGANGEFFVGFSGTTHRVDSLPRGKCVAVKKMASEESDKWCNAIRVLQWFQWYIDGTKRRHIVKLLDAGHEEGTNSMIIVTELGDETLKQRLYAENRTFLVHEMAMKIVTPLVELHRGAMHLDIKPSNYVFFKSEGDALKLIDFDGAQLLLEGGRPCHRKIPQANAHTIRYMSPEQDEHIFKQRTELSVKADIWSMGMITWEIILQNPFYNCLFCNNEHMDVPLVLHYISKFYRGYRIVSKDNEDTAFVPLNLDGDQWLDKGNYYDTLEFIVRVAADHSLLFHLLINALQLDPEERMSARGIVNYLDERCIPMTSKRISDVWALPLFHAVTVGRLKGTFEARKDHKMLGLLQVVEEQQRKALNKLQMRGTICETRNILMGEGGGKESVDQTEQRGDKEEKRGGKEEKRGGKEEKSWNKEEKAGDKKEKSGDKKEKSGDKKAKSGDKKEKSGDKAKQREDDKEHQQSAKNKDKKLSSPKSKNVFCWTIGKEKYRRLKEEGDLPFMA